MGPDLDPGPRRLRPHGRWHGGLIVGRLCRVARAGRAAVLGMGCLVLVLTLLGCSANSSGCDRAAGLVGQGKLAEAARAYAAAQRKDDSRCAREGLQRVAKLQADALTEVAK